MQSQMLDQLPRGVVITTVVMGKIGGAGGFGLGKHIDHDENLPPDRE